MEPAQPPILTNRQRPTDAPLLIANADDFGWSDPTVDATIRCFEAGMLSSATLMVNRPAFGRAAAFARANPQFSFGLHLCLVDEAPVCNPKEIPSLVGRDGRFYQTADFLKRAFTGRVAQTDVAREILAQMRCLLDAGLTVSHVDSHGHMHRVPVVVCALLRLAAEIRVPAIRRPQDLFTEHRQGPMGRLYNQVVTKFLARRYRMPDHFLMVAGHLGENADGWFNRALEVLPHGVTEIGYHPGCEEEEFRALETRGVLAAGRQALERNRVRLMTYKELAMPA